MGSKTDKSAQAPKRRRRGRKLFVLGVIGLAAAAFKATRDAGSTTPAAQAPAPAPSPTPAPTPAPSPAPPAAYAHPSDVSTEPDPIEQLETESADVPDLLAADVLDAAAPVEPPVPAPLPEPVLEDVPEPAPPAEDLHDIVEEPWTTEAEVTPVTEPPVDSLTSFFDEVMTDTTERKLRKGH